MSDHAPSTREADRQPAGAFAHLDRLLDEINEACDALGDELDEFDTAPHGPADAPPEPSSDPALDPASDTPPDPADAPPETDARVDSSEAGAESAALAPINPERDPAAAALLAEINAELSGIEAELAPEAPAPEAAALEAPAPEAAALDAPHPGADASAASDAPPGDDADDPFGAMFEDPDTGETSPADIDALVAASEFADPAAIGPDHEQPAGTHLQGEPEPDAIVDKAAQVATPAATHNDRTPRAEASEDDCAPPSSARAAVSQPEPTHPPTSAPSDSPPPPQPTPARRPRQPSRLPQRAAALLARVLNILGKPLASQPRVVRDSIGWIGAVTLFYGLCVWLYLLVFHDPAPTATTRPAAISAPTPDGGSVSVPDN